MSPIPVERFKGDQSMQIACEHCHADKTLTVDELLNEGLYPCPADCGGTAVYKYEETPRCPGCLRFVPDLLVAEKLDGCCSRVCQLQAEYAESLKGGGKLRRDQGGHVGLQPAKRAGIGP